MSTVLLDAAVRQHCQALLALADTALLDASPRGWSRLAEAYQALLVDFTEEDQQAKGLRRFQPGQAATDPVYFSALERVEQTPRLLLHGDSGSGKSSFCRHLAWQLARSLLGDAPADAVSQYVPRNEKQAPRAERWSLAHCLPFYLPATADAGQALPALHALLAAHLGPVLLILDGLEQAAGAAEALLRDAIALSAAEPRLRLLVCARSAWVEQACLPADLPRHALLPWLGVQRQQWLARYASATLPAEQQPDRPGWLALAAGRCADTHPLALATHWLAQSCPAALRAEVLVHAYQRQASDGPCAAAPLPAALHGSVVDIGLRQPFLVELLAALHLSQTSDAVLADLLASDSLRWRSVVEHCATLRQAQGEALAPMLDSLLRHPDAHGECVLLAARLLGEAPAQRPAQLSERLLRLLDAPQVALAGRRRAAHFLACWGDPRDLQQLLPVPAGHCHMGSTLTPQSSPPHRVELAAFSIGRYPVCNRWFLDFVEATGHLWRSHEGRLPHLSNAPAVDLTWHDATAFCRWLSDEWRRSGRIGAGQRVRLPSEPEWEYAARGSQANGDPYCVYPWGSAWQPDHGNGEEAGLNGTCAVGLFPKGRSPWGCDDMCGQVWEWTSTLWGERMDSPHWPYPYADDGREAADAPDRVRRVLRGGCFSSPAYKACCTYRGSLEANGFWRGNGFRIVVADA